MPQYKDTIIIYVDSLKYNKYNRWCNKPPDEQVTTNATGLVITSLKY